MSNDTHGIEVKVAEDGTFTVTQRVRRGTWFSSQTYYRVRQLRAVDGGIEFTTGAPV